jgi:gamma-glutamyltranspeptidase/glutathione hydrolase
MQPMNFDFTSRRSMVVARRGMVAASNPLASQAGLRILRAGGNAADAAIAAAAVMNVTAPASTGIGGDCFALYYDADTQQVSALNGSGRAPQALNLDTLKAAGIEGEMPARSVHAVTVPGAARGWEDLLNRFGTLSLADVLQDAIHYAEDGYAVSPVFGTFWGQNETAKWLKSKPHTDDYVPDGKTPGIGDVMRLPGLARTFKAVADGGADAFYTGAIADAIVSTVQAEGGLLTHEDLAQHTSTWSEPIQADYRGYQVLEHPPNGQGLAALIALRIAAGWELDGRAWHSPEKLHLMIEAMRLAFADAKQYIADPQTDPAPVAFLLSEDYIAQRRGMIADKKAMQPPSYGTPPDSSDTIYLCVVDGDGNACSFINSLYMGFGSGIVAKDYGVFLQNRGANFSLQPGHPNQLEGGKRPYHTIIPGMLVRDGELVAPFGVMGGFMQPQGHLQVISAMLDDDLNPQEALDRPRWCLTSGTPDSGLALEDGIPGATMARLAELGHLVRPVVGQGRAVFGSGQIIRRDADTGVLYGGSDPRKDGLVAGY